MDDRQYCTEVGKERVDDTTQQVEGRCGIEVCGQLVYSGRTDPERSCATASMVDLPRPCALLLPRSMSRNGGSRSVDGRASCACSNGHGLPWGCTFGKVVFLNMFVDMVPPTIKVGGC